MTTTTVTNLVNTGITWYLTKNSTIDLFQSMLKFVDLNLDNDDWKTLFNNKYVGWNEIANSLEKIVNQIKIKGIEFVNNNETLNNSYLTWILKTDNSNFLQKDLRYPPLYTTNYREKIIKTIQQNFLQLFNKEFFGQNITNSNFLLASFDPNEIKRWKTLILNDIFSPIPFLNYSDALIKLESDFLKIEIEKIEKNEHPKSLEISIKNILKAKHDEIKLEMNKYLETLKKNETFAPSANFLPMYNIINPYINQLKLQNKAEFLQLNYVIQRLINFGTTNDVVALKNLTEKSVFSVIERKSVLEDVLKYLFPINPEQITVEGDNFLKNMSMINFFQFLDYVIRSISTEIVHL